MGLEDLVIGWVLSKFFGKGGGETRSPAVVFPANGQAPAAPNAPPQFPAQVPASAPAAAPQGQPAPAGFKRAIEVWVVQPSLVQQGSAALSGMDPQVGAIAIQALQAQFPKGWQAATSATGAEAAEAKALLAQWQDGGVVFRGPATLAGRRAYRMTKHPAGQQPAPQAPAAPPPDFPQQVPVPAQAPPAATPAVPEGNLPSGGTLPEVLITADVPPPGAPAAQPVNQITAVRKGEGLANVARRLGQPATGVSAAVLQKANVPGPDGWFTAQSLDKGGLKKKNRAGGLQPGDRLFVPPQWGPVDAASL